MLLGNGDGSFQSARSFLAGGGPIAAAAADLNGDSHPDLAVANSDTNNVSVLLNSGSWSAAQVAYFYIYPDYAAVPAGAAFDLYVIAYDADFNLLTNYTGEIYFYATDQLAVAPVSYRFQLSDGGVAYFPNGLTFNTPGFQELYVLDVPDFRAWGYAAYDVVGAAPGGGGTGGGIVPDLFAAEELGRESGGLAYGPTALGTAPLDERPPAGTAASEKDWRGLPELPAPIPGRVEPTPRPLLDHLFVMLNDSWPRDEFAVAKRGG